MLKKILKNKISEKKGASLAMALFALIVVTVVATVILGSALANIGRVRRNQQVEQNYLTVSSAAELMKECLDGFKISWDYTTKDDGGTYTKPNPTVTDKFGSKGSDYKNPLTDDLKTWFESNAVNNTSKRLDKYYYIDLDGTDTLSGNVKVYDVVVHAVLEGKQFNNMAVSGGDDDDDSTGTGSGTGGSGTGGGSTGSRNSSGSGSSSGNSESTDSREESAKLKLYFTLVGPDGSDSSKIKAVEQNYHITLSQSFNCTYEESSSPEKVTTGTPPNESTTTVTKTEYKCEFNASSCDISKGLQ